MSRMASRSATVADRIKSATPALLRRTTTLSSSGAAEPANLGKPFCPRRSRVALDEPGHPSIAGPDLHELQPVEHEVVGEVGQVRSADNECPAPQAGIILEVVPENPDVRLADPFAGQRGAAGGVPGEAPLGGR